LLLIVVVIVAVATLASFVSIAETNANNRSALLTSLKNENLQVVNAAFQANLTSKAAIGMRSIPILWNNVTLTVRNSNTANSQLNQIKLTSPVAAYWFPTWKVVSGPLGSVGTYVVGKNNSLIIPAKGSVSILLKLVIGSTPTKFSSLNFSRSSAISITLLTASGNFFTTVYNPPTANEQVSLSSVSYQYFNRDVVSLDGSQSQGSNSSQIVSYTWSVDVPTTTCTITSLNGVRGTSYVRVFVTGKTTKFFQEAFPSLSGDCLTGPFRIGLSVIDQLGFIGNSTAVILSADPNMAPIATLTTGAGASPSCAAGPNIVVTVADVFGRPVPGVTVLAASTGLLTLSASSYQTGAGGSVTLTKGGSPGYTCTGAGNAIFTVTINNLPPSAVIFGT